MLHLFLSPHYDDAILSFGGHIFELVNRGIEVEILTIFGATNPNNLSREAMSLHHKWGIQGADISIRKVENKHAAQVLGAHTASLEYLDCIYRFNKSGLPLYPSRTSRFGHISDADSELSLAITDDLFKYVASKLPSVVYAPAAIGSHVDHQITFRIGQQLNSLVSEVLFYEDFPYPLLFDVKNEVSALRNMHYTLHKAYCSELAIQKKIESIRCYQTQTPTLFGSFEDSCMAIYENARSQGCGGLAENYWRQP